MTTPTVLFLCIHNAGRSQMALGWFTELAGEQHIDATMELMPGAGHTFPPEYQAWFRTWCAEKPAPEGR